MNKCNDCGDTFETERQRGRIDVCDKCWKIRGVLIQGPNSLGITMAQFQAIQRAMGSGRGTAHRKIISAIGKDSLDMLLELKRQSSEQAVSGNKHAN